jgi:hypothetical protein
MNYLNSLKTTKFEEVDSSCNNIYNQINNESKKTFLKNINWSFDQFLIKDSNYFLENNKLFYLNSIKNNTLESQSLVVSSIENLININSRFINKLYEKRNLNDSNCIQNQISQLVYEYGMLIN